MTPTTKFGPMLATVAAMALVGAAALIPFAAPHAQGPAASRIGVVTHDLYSSGASVDVSGLVMGDAIVAGGRVRVDGQITGDVMAAGGLVDIRGQIGDDVRVAGGRVVIDARIADSLVAAGGNVSVMPASRIGGESWLAGGNVEVAGVFAKTLHVAAASVTLGGEIKGDVDVVAAWIEVLPGTAIGGRLIYRSTEPARIDPAAKIAGGVERTLIGPRLPDARTFRIVRAGTGLVFAAGLFVVGAALLLIFPGFALGAARAIGSDPLKSLGLGFALLVATPVAALIAIVTLAGAMLGLALIALYLVALLAGFLAAAIFVGDLGLRAIGRSETAGRILRLFSLLVGLALLAVLRAVPLVGGLAIFAALVLGLGAGALEGYRRYART